MRILTSRHLSGGQVSLNLDRFTDKEWVSYVQTADLDRPEHLARAVRGLVVSARDWLGLPMGDSHALLAQALGQLLAAAGRHADSPEALRVVDWVVQTLADFPSDAEKWGGLAALVANNKAWVAKILVQALSEKRRVPVALQLAMRELPEHGGENLQVLRSLHAWLTQYFFRLQPAERLTKSAKRADLLALAQETVLLARPLAPWFAYLMGEHDHLTGSGVPEEVQWQWVEGTAEVAAFNHDLARLLPSPFFESGEMQQMVRQRVSHLLPCGHQLLPRDQQALAGLFRSLSLAGMSPEQVVRALLATSAKISALSHRWMEALLPVIQSVQDEVATAFPVDEWMEQWRARNLRTEAAAAAESSNSEPSAAEGRLDPESLLEKRRREWSAALLDTLLTEPTTEFEKEIRADSLKRFGAGLVNENQLLSGSLSWERLSDAQARELATLVRQMGEGDRQILCWMALAAARDTDEGPSPAAAIGRAEASHLCLADPEWVMSWSQPRVVGQRFVEQPPFVHRALASMNHEAREALYGVFSRRAFKKGLITRYAPLWMRERLEEEFLNQLGALFKQGRLSTLELVPVFMNLTRLGWGLSEENLARLASLCAQAPKGRGEASLTPERLLYFWVSGVVSMIEAYGAKPGTADLVHEVLRGWESSPRMHQVFMTMADWMAAHPEHMCYSAESWRVIWNGPVRISNDPSEGATCIPVWGRFFLTEQVADPQARGESLVRFRALDRKELASISAWIRKNKPAQGDFGRVLVSTLEEPVEAERTRRLEVMEKLGPSVVAVRLSADMVALLRRPGAEQVCQRFLEWVKTHEEALISLDDAALQFLFEHHALPKRWAEELCAGWFRDEVRPSLSSSSQLARWPQERMLALFDRQVRRSDLLSMISLHDLRAGIQHRFAELEAPTESGVSRWVLWAFTGSCSRERTAAQIRAFLDLGVRAEDFGPILSASLSRDAEEGRAELLRRKASHLRIWLAQGAGSADSSALLRLVQMNMGLEEWVWPALLQRMLAGGLKGKALDEILAKYRALPVSGRLHALFSIRSADLPAPATVLPAVSRFLLRDLLTQLPQSIPDEHMAWLEQLAIPLEQADSRAVGHPTPRLLEVLHTATSRSGISRWVRWWLCSSSGAFADASKGLTPALRDALVLSPTDQTWLIQRLAEGAELPVWILERLARSAWEPSELLHNLPARLVLWRHGRAMETADQQALVEGLLQTQQQPELVLRAVDRQRAFELIKGWSAEAREAWMGKAEELAEVLQLTDRQRHELSWPARPKTPEPIAVQASIPAAAAAPTVEEARRVTLAPTFQTARAALALDAQEQKVLEQRLEELAAGAERRVRPNPIQLEWNQRTFTWDHQHISTGRGNPLVLIYERTGEGGDLRIVDIYRHDNAYERALNNAVVLQGWARQWEQSADWTSWEKGNGP
jgi:hypothetical protein